MRRRHLGCARVSYLRPGRRLLMITTPIYVPSRHLAAVRMLALPHCVEIDTVGTKYLLEVRSTIRALRRLDGEVQVA